MVVCKICHKLHGKIVKAKYVAPQYAGGDEDGHVFWTPVCGNCYKGWYADIPANRQLQTFVLNKYNHQYHPDHSLLEA